MGRLILVYVVSILLFTPVCLARTWSVPSAECPTIKAGIDSAGVGDTVLVAAGTYTGAGNKNLDFGGTDLVLLSEAGPELTVIDCEGSGRGFYFHSGENVAAVVEGFTVTNGEVGIGIGGGMYCSGSSPTVRGCIFSVNTANYGGGMGCDDSSPTVSGCTFSENTAEYGLTEPGGGGMYCGSYSSPTVSNCTFSGNSGNQSGGGMDCYYYSSPTVSNCTFIGNSAGSGGGMYCWVGSSPIVSNCTFSGNSATVFGGGGMYFYDDSATVSNCTFSGNGAGWGGGIHCYESSLDISNCTFVGNSADYGGGMWCNMGSPTVSSCTFSENSALRVGGGMYWGGPPYPLIENTIIAGSVAGEAVWCESGSAATLTCCDVYGNAGGDYVGCIADQYGINGNFSACPSFCNVAGGDFHLCDESPCAPGNHPDGHDCGLIGAWPVGCSCGPSRTEGTTWSAIKAMYR